MAQACAFNAVPICTAYDSLGPDGLTHSLNETEVRSMFTNADLLPTLTKIIGKCGTVKLVVYDGKAEEGVVGKLQAAKEGLQVAHIDEVIQKGKANPKEAVRAKPEDVYCCMYTSGSSEYHPCHRSERSMKSGGRKRLNADEPSWHPQGCSAHTPKCHSS